MTQCTICDAIRCFIVPILIYTAFTYRNGAMPAALSFTYKFFLHVTQAISTIYRFVFSTLNVERCFTIVRFSSKKGRIHKLLQHPNRVMLVFVTLTILAYSIHIGVNGIEINQHNATGATFITYLRVVVHIFESWRFVLVLFSLTF